MRGMNSRTRKTIEEAQDWCSRLDEQIPREPPHELPDLQLDDSFLNLSKVEMEHREMVSRKIFYILLGEKVSCMSLVEMFLLRFRLEWAFTVLKSYLEQGINDFDMETNVLMHYLLIDTWNSQGCVRLWNATSDAEYFRQSLDSSGSNPNSSLPSEADPETEKPQ